MQLNVRGIAIGLGILALGVALGVCPLVSGYIAGTWTRPAAATPLPTNTPMPTTVPTCSLAAYNLPGEVFDGGSVDVNIGGSIVTVLCKNGHIGIKSLTIQPGGCWVDQQNNLYIPDGAPWTMPNGQSVVCKNGNLQAIGGPAPVPASPTPPPAGCTADGFTFQTNDTWVINGQKSVCNNGGWMPLSAFPPTATPTLAPTAAMPVNAGFCPLPSPDGYGQTGGFQPIGTRPTGSAYVCMPNGQGQNIWVDP